MVIIENKKEILKNNHNICEIFDNSTVYFPKFYNKLQSYWNLQKKKKKDKEILISKFYQRWNADVCISIVVTYMTMNGSGELLLD